MNIDGILAEHNKYFDSGNTLGVDMRLDALAALQSAMVTRRDTILAAISEDTGKSSLEGLMCEFAPVKQEIDFFLHNLRRLARPRRVRTGLMHFRSSAFEQAAPLGTALCISPWNYPFLLSLQPLVDAVAAGDTVMLRLSSEVPHVAAALNDLVASVFEAGHATVVVDEHERVAETVKRKFDIIMFTGGDTAGREVYKSAAANLTPVILELGGKSPCIVDETADIAAAARRIVFGKFLNAGQTCAAPDYVLVRRSEAEALISALTREIAVQYPRPCPLSPLRRQRIERLISGTVVCGGPSPEGFYPTLVKDAPPRSPLMSEEIFGPVLPIIEVGDFDEALEYVKERPAPLALYVFTRDKSRAARALNELRFGGGCVNDTVMQLTVKDLPFGGVGGSGMGRYHGRAGFFAFSSVKSVLVKRAFPDLAIRYPPYDEKKEKAIRHILK